MSPSFCYKVVERNNPLAVHAICNTLDRAENWIDTIAPEYVKKGFFTNKDLAADSFVIVFTHKGDK